MMSTGDGVRHGWNGESDTTASPGRIVKMPHEEGTIRGCVHAAADLLHDIDSTLDLRELQVAVEATYQRRKVFIQLPRNRGVNYRKLAAFHARDVLGWNREELLRITRQRRGAER